ncbi:MAG: YcxB family protein [Coprobacillus cateniformis]|uniref:YcxB family protein n=1 Tax=Longibaculum muris TaxID=1796628 RepID=UPI003AB533DD|nr:YcxB family protein [Coprobacillus cateniformis]
MNHFEIKNNTIDESVIHEIRPFLIEKWRKYMIIFIGLIMLFLAFYGYASPHNIIRVILVSGFPIFIFSIILVIRMPINTEKRMLETIKEVHNGSYCYDISLTENSIKIDNSSVEINYNYISRIVITERTITLFTKSNACLILRKDGLEFKTYNQIVDFLHSICKNAKLIYK